MSKRAQRRLAASLRKLRRELRKTFVDVDGDPKPDTVNFGALDTQIRQQRQEIERRNGYYIATYVALAMVNGEHRVPCPDEARLNMEVLSYYTKDSSAYRLGKRMTNIVITNLPEDVSTELDLHGNVTLRIDD